VLHYSFTEKKNQSFLINNIQNSRRDLNSTHLRCHEGSRPDWPESWLGKGFIQLNFWQNLGGPDHPYCPSRLWREDSSSLDRGTVRRCSETAGEGRALLLPTCLRRLNKTAGGVDAGGGSACN